MVLLDYRTLVLVRLVIDSWNINLLRNHGNGKSVVIWDLPTLSILTNYLLSKRFIGCEVKVSD